MLKTSSFLTSESHREGTSTIPRSGNMELFQKQMMENCFQLFRYL